MTDWYRGGGKFNTVNMLHINSIQFSTSLEECVVKKMSCVCVVVEPICLSTDNPNQPKYELQQVLIRVGFNIMPMWNLVKCFKMHHSYLFDKLVGRGPSHCMV